MENNPYIVLGVGRNASAAEIKQAWASKVHEHPPEVDPEGNQRINEARRVLLDPGERAKLNAFLDHGDKLAALFAQMELAEAAEDYSQAARACERVLAIAPEITEVRARHAQYLLLAGESHRALPVVRELVREHPDNAAYHHLLAEALTSTADGDGAAAYLDEALSAARRAVDLNPNNPNYRSRLAYLLLKAGRSDEAEKHLEAALWTDGKLDTQDLRILFDLVMAHILAGQPEKVQQDVNRILDVVKNASEGVRGNCAARFHELGVALIDAGSWQLAADMVNAASDCLPEYQDLREFAERIKGLAAIDAELQKLETDTTLPNRVKALFEVLGRVKLREISEDDAKRALEAVVNALQPGDQSKIRQAQTRYPNIYRAWKDLFDNLEEALANNGYGAGSVQSYSGTHSPVAVRSSSGPNGCVVALIVIGILVLLAMGPVGWMIGLFLLYIIFQASKK